MRQQHVWLQHLCGLQATLKAYASAEALWLADQPSRVKSTYLCKCFPGADAKVVHAALTSCRGVTEQSIQVWPKLTARSVVCCLLTCVSAHMLNQDNKACTLHCAFTSVQGSLYMALSCMMLVAFTGTLAGFCRKCKQALACYSITLAA